MVMISGLKNVRYTPCRKLLNNIVRIEHCSIHLNYYLLFITKYPLTIVSAHAYAINVYRYLFIINMHSTRAIQLNHNIKLNTYTYYCILCMHSV